MAFDRPTIAELISRVEADFQQRLGIGALLPRSVLKALARAEAGAAHLLHGHLEYVTQQILPDSADGVHLERWASIFGVTRLPAAKARGISEWTGTNGVLIPAGTIFQNAAGVRFDTDNPGTVVAGAVNVVSSQVQPFGTSGNMGAGATLTLVTPIAGLNTQGQAGSLGFGGGADEETDPELLARLLIEIQTPPEGGAEIDYEIWALRVEGVTRAWTLPLHFGVGSVGLTFMRDNDSPALPDAAEVQAVQDFVDILRPVAVPLFTVFAPVLVPQAFTIDLTSPPQATDSAAIQAAIEANLTQLILDDAEPGGTLLISRVRETISNADGETDHILTFPTADVTVQPGELTTLGTVTFL